MDAAVVRQFFNFFQDFIDLCQWKDWPSNETTDQEIRSAFDKSRHIEKCLDKFKKNKTIDDFLATLNSAQDSTDAFLKACLAEPPKYILKKIINSNCEINLIDSAFKIFLQLFTEEKLESYLTDLILEASSKETLLKYLPTVIPRDKILKFKSEILLSQITADSNESLKEMLKNYNKEIIEVVVVGLCSTNPMYQKSVNIMSQCVLDVILSKSNHNKTFWKLLFSIKDKYLIDMCVENSDLFTYICEALIDCGKLLKENMSAEYFYMDFTYLELVSNTRKLFNNKFLKAQFFDVLSNHESDKDFWQNM